MANDPTAESLNRVTKGTVRLYVVLFSVNALCSCIIAAFTNATWEDMLWPKRVLTAIAIVGNWTTVLLAFYSKTVARMEAGKSPIPTNGTEMFTKGPDGTVQKQ